MDPLAILPEQGKQKIFLLYHLVEWIILQFNMELEFLKSKCIKLQKGCVNNFWVWVVLFVQNWDQTEVMASVVNSSVWF